MEIKMYIFTLFGLNKGKKLYLHLLWIKVQCLNYLGFIISVLSHFMSIVQVREPNRQNLYPAALEESKLKA